MSVKEAEFVMNPENWGKSDEIQNSDEILAEFLEKYRKMQIDITKMPSILFHQNDEANKKHKEGIETGICAFKWMRNT